MNDQFEKFNDPFFFLSFSVTRAHSKQLFSFVYLFFYIPVDITNGNDKNVIPFSDECVLCAVIENQMFFLCFFLYIFLQSRPCDLNLY